MIGSQAGSETFLGWEYRRHVSKMKKYAPKIDPVDELSRDPSKKMHSFFEFAARKFGRYEKFA
jgi:hypothetical protein